MTQATSAGVPSLSRLPIEYPSRLFTVADLAAMPSELPSGTVLYELDNGRLITMAPPGEIHGSVEAMIVSALITQGDLRGFGRTSCGEVGVILWRNPDRVVGADALFVTNASLPLRRSSEGYLETIPELVLEVRSKNDTQPAVERKVGDYITAGVRVVWVANPEARTVTIYRRDVPPQELGVNDTLTADECIPGFRLPVSDIFRD
jgi:Uma2 family endonuclease